MSSLDWLRPTAAVVAFVGAPAWAVSSAQRFYEPPHRIASNSMAPTLVRGDTVITVAMATTDLRRGTIVLFRKRGEVWVLRIAGLPGDKIQLRNGLVYLNGVAAPQRPTGKSFRKSVAAWKPATVLVEVFPGERGHHRILDNGFSAGDDTNVVTVPAGRLFLLGDNRDNANDSRYPPVASNGPGLVPVADIIGKVGKAYRLDGGQGR